MFPNLATRAEAFTSNVYLLEGERTVIVDAGWKFDVVEAIREHVADLDALILTHAHPDHVGNIDDVREAFGIDVWGYDTDSEYVDRAIADGDSVRMGDRAYEALFTPGHAVDHLCFYDEDAGVLLSGDLIFADGAVGRTDFDGGDPALLAESVDRVADRVDGSLEALVPQHGRPVTEDAMSHVAMAQRAAQTM